MAPKLLSIPRELREIIYEHVYTDKTVVDICILDTCVIVTTHPLRQTCKQLANESLEAYLKFSVFNKGSSSMWLASAWLPKVSTSMYKHFRTIRCRASTDWTNEEKAGMLSREQDSWTGYGHHPELDRKAFQTTFTTRSGGVVWASALPDGCELGDKGGERNQPARNESLSIEEVRGTKKGEGMRLTCCVLRH